jgi:hypothetical protein
MRPLALVGFSMTVLLLAGPLQAHWAGAQDNKSAANLAAETTEQLFDEAFDVCVRRALLESVPDVTPQSLAECNDYFDAIAAAVRAQHADHVPRWMDELMNAHTTKECQRAVRTYRASQTEKSAVPKRSTPAAAVRRPQAAAMPKTTPKLPRSHWTEQLPPWITPH